MVKLLLRNTNKGAWADRVFTSQAKNINQHATTLFIGHLTTKQVISDALRELLLLDPADFTLKKLLMTTYLLKHGAEGDIVDETFLLATQKLEHEWVVALYPRLSISTTPLTAFKKITRDTQSEVSLSGKRLEMVQFFLKQGLQAPAVDETFVRFAAAGNFKGVRDLLPSISARNTFSEALDALSMNMKVASTDAGRSAISTFIENGASEASVLNCTRIAARSHSRAIVELVVENSEHKTVCKAAAFQGLMDEKRPLESSESLAMLRYLVIFGLGSEDARKVASMAASKHDIALITAITPSGSSEELYAVALTTLAATDRQWLCAAGLSFLEHILNRGVRGPILVKLIETAARAKHLSALRLLQSAYEDKVHGANVAFAALTPDNKVPSSAEGLAVMEFLLEAGANGLAVQNIAAKAATTSNYEALEIFLKSPAAASIIPDAFRAVTRKKTKRLSSEQLSVASILVKQGVSTEVLAIASIETAKLLDLEALKVLSKSPRFVGVTDETLRALLLDEALWRCPQGLRIMQHLFEIGVTLQSTEAAASKAAVALDIDALHVILASNTSSELTEGAFASMTGAGNRWLSPEGLRVVDLLLKYGPSQTSVDSAFIQASRYLNHDAVQLLQPYIIDASIFSVALAKATDNESGWLSEPHLIGRLLDSCVDGDVIESSLIKSAQGQSFGCLELLSARVDRWEVYAKALAALKTNQNWRQSAHIIEFLLDHGAQGQSVEEAYIAAAGDLDYRITVLLAGHVDNAEVDSQAFSAATAGVSWLSPGHMGLVEFLYHRGATPIVIQTALDAAAKALNVPAVELLAKSVNENVASAAFAAAISDGNDWTSAEGTSILEILVQRGARGDAVDKAMISSAEQRRFDLLQILYPNVHEESKYALSAAFDAVIAENDLWLSNSDALDTLQILIVKGAVPESAPDALVLAAQNANLDAVMILTEVVDDPLVYTQAFNVFAQSGSLWLQDDSHELLQHLLNRGVPDDGLHENLITATGEVLLGVASIDLLVLLLEHGARINHSNGSALQLAAKYGRFDLIELFSRYQPNTITLYMGLQEALCSNHDEQMALDVLRSIVGNDSGNAKPYINHDSNLGSPLIFYCLKNYPFSVDLAKEIVDLGADLNATIIWSVYQDEPNFPAPAPEKIPPLLFALLVQASDEIIIDVLCKYAGGESLNVTDCNYAY